MNLMNFPISAGLPIFPVGRVFSKFFKLFTNSLTLLVLKGPGAILMVEIPNFELILEKDLSKLLVADLIEEDNIRSLLGSFIIEEEI